MTIGKPILSIFNVHAACCRKSPSFVKRAGDSDYYGFFESDFGDQHLVVIDRRKKTGLLYVADYSWTKPFTLADNRILGDIILDDETANWLRACWKAATGEVLAYTTIGELVNKAKKELEDSNAQ